MTRTLLWFCLSGAIANAAAMITIEPATQVIFGGQQAVVDLILSGSPDAIGSFDIDVSFDPALLMGAGAIFFTHLGDPGMGEALTDTIISSGVINVASVSLLFDPMVLDQLQPDPFLLARLILAPTGGGMTTLTITREDVDDPFGVKLPVTTGEAIVTVIPEAGSLLLIGGGLAGLAGLRTRRRARG